MVCIIKFIAVSLSMYVSVCLCYAALISLIGVIIFAKQFYGDLDVSPFGWSFALTIVGLLFFAINGCVLILLTVMIQMYVSKMRYQAVGQTRRGYGGVEGFLKACIPCL